MRSLLNNDLGGFKMKQLIVSLVLTLAATQVFAYGGSSDLICKSASKSGSNQVVEVKLKRSNGSGWFTPVISATVDGKEFVLTTTDEMKSYGSTFHNSPLGVITATANNFEEINATTYGTFSVVAIPRSVQSFDLNGKPVKWNFEAEKDECNDSSGKAKFQGIIRGFLKSGTTRINIDTQVLDCELNYNSGMAC